jgi:hypothetical protein
VSERDRSHERGGNEFSRILDGELSGGTDPLRPVSYWKIRFNNGNVAIITEKPDVVSLLFSSLGENGTMFRPVP